MQKSEPYHGKIPPVIVTVDRSKGHISCAGIVPSRLKMCTVTETAVGRGGGTGHACVDAGFCFETRSTRTREIDVDSRLADSFVNMRFRV